MKKLLTGLMAVVMMAGLAGCGSKDDGAGEGSDTAKKELTVYTNSGYKPYEMVDEKGNLYGFDIDVMNEAAKLAGYTVKWEDVDFDGIVPSVKQGKADIGIAGITYTEERAKQVDFSEVGVEHLNKMLDVCIASYLYALEAFESNDRENALKTIEKETEADGLEISLRAKHIKRLTNQQCNTEAGVVFLDSLVCLERISDHARNIAEEVLAE